MTPDNTLINIGEGTQTGLACSQIDEYLKYHHRTFIKQLMETEAETRIRALDWPPNVQLKSERSENMSKKVKTLMGTPTETIYLS